MHSCQYRRVPKEPKTGLNVSINMLCNTYSFITERLILFIRFIPFYFLGNKLACTVHPIIRLYFTSELN